MSNPPKIKIDQKFYEQLQNTWSDTNKLKNLNNSTILNQPLWNNRYIIKNKKTLFWENWHNHGINHIYNIVDKQGNFLSHTQLNEKYSIQCNFLEVLDIRQNIPREWKEIIQSKGQTKHYEHMILLKDQFDIYTPLQHITCNSVYWSIVMKKLTQSACIPRWIDEYENLKSVDNSLWENIYMSPFKILRDTKLQGFQFKIIHRLITCREKLKEYRLADNTNCLYCRKYDNPTHFFITCKNVNDFWGIFLKW